MASVVLAAPLAYEGASLMFLRMALGPGLECCGGYGAREEKNGSEALHVDLKE